MITYTVFIKSHALSPDYEESFSVEELADRRCRIKWADDIDQETGEVQVARCGGDLITLENGDLKCLSCGEIYAKE